MLAVDKTEREERKKAVIDQLGPGGRSMMRREKVPNWERRNFLSSVRNNKPTTTTTTHLNLIWTPRSSASCFDSCSATRLASLSAHRPRLPHHYLPAEVVEHQRASDCLAQPANNVVRSLLDAHRTSAKMLMME